MDDETKERASRCKRELARFRLKISDLVVEETSSREHFTILKDRYGFPRTIDLASLLAILADGHSRLIYWVGKGDVTAGRLREGREVVSRTPAPERSGSDPAGGCLPRSARG
jgi:hypothetical protein